MAEITGTFITIEGIDGAGKTTQGYYLAKGLEPNAIFTREPGGTPIADHIRDVFMAAEGITPMAEFLLVSASRSQHVENLIRPELEQGKTVICDRFTDSSMAYQGYRGGVSLSFIEEINSVVTDGLIPNLTFLLDLDPKIGLSRKKQKNVKINRLDGEKLESHYKIRNGYLAIAEKNPGRIKVIDAAQSFNFVQSILLHKCKEYISQFNN